MMMTWQYELFIIFVYKICELLVPRVVSLSIYPLVQIRTTNPYDDNHLKLIFQDHDEVTQHNILKAHPFASTPQPFAS